MKITGKKFLAAALVALVGMSVATPAHARWYDGHYWHRGHAPHGWVWNPTLGYYVAQPGAVVVAQPAPAVVVAQPGAVVAAPAPQPQTVIVQQPQPQAVIVQQPAPVVVEQPAPPIGLSLGVHVR